MARTTLQDIAARIAQSWKGGDPRKLEQLISDALNKLEPADSTMNAKGDQRLGPPDRVNQLPDPNSPQSLNPASPSKQNYGPLPSVAPPVAQNPAMAKQNATVRTQVQAGLYQDTMGEAAAKADQIDPSGDPVAVKPLAPGTGGDQPGIGTVLDEELPEPLPMPLGQTTKPSGEVAPGTPVLLKRPDPSEIPPPPPQGEQGVADTRRGMALGLTFIPYNDDDLVMKKGMSIYDDMRKDDQVKACLLLKKCAILGPGWDIEPTDNHDAAAVQLALEIKEDLLNMHGTFHSALMNMLTAFDFGFSASEIVWELPETSEERIRVKAIKTRAPHDIDFQLDPHGNVTALLQLQGAGLSQLMYSKFIHLAYRDEFSNPYGRSDLREAHRSWWLKRNFLQWWAIFAEKLSDPPLIATHPTNAGKPQVDKVLQVLERMQAKTAMTVPDPWKVELLETKADPRAMFESAINHFNLSIARALLVPDKSGFSGSGGTGGSYAQSKTEMAAFEMVLEMTARWLEANIQEQLINKLVKYNYGPKIKCPRFVLLPISQENKLQIAQMWTAAVNGQVVMADFDDEQHFRNLLGFPEKNEKERVRWDQLHEQKAQLRLLQSLPPPPSGGGGPPKPGGAKPPGGGGDGGDSSGGDGPGNPFKALGGNPFGGHANPLPGMEKGSQYGAFGGAKQTFTSLVTEHVADTEQGPLVATRPLTEAEVRADMGEKLTQYDRYTPPVSQALVGGVLGILTDLKQQIKSNPKLTMSDVSNLKPSPHTMQIAQKEIEHALSAAFAASRDSAQREVARAKIHLTELRTRVKGSVEVAACDILSQLLDAYPFDFVISDTP